MLTICDVFELFFDCISELFIKKNVIIAFDKKIIVSRIKIIADLSEVISMRIKITTEFVRNYKYSAQNHSGIYKKLQ
ncbi:MAG: hypothetical protein IJ681_05065 [Bacteroidales bacterium]|nr:hypothetical protein [Bacteroidales bacterium]